MGHPDPDADIDGNAVLVSDSLNSATIISHDILHLSGVRNCQLVKIVLPNSRLLYFVNTHLHHPLEEDHIRVHQVEQLTYWLDQQAKDDPDSIRVVVGDFNANPYTDTYKHFEAQGYTSAYKKVHGAEPEKTFPTGL